MMHYRHTEEKNGTIRIDLTEFTCDICGKEGKLPKLQPVIFKNEVIEKEYIFALCSSHTKEEIDKLIANTKEKF